MGFVKDIGDEIGDVLRDPTGSKAAAKGALKGSETAAAAQQASLDYLRQQEAVPSAFREAALGQLGAEYGLTMDQEGNIIQGGGSMIDRAQQSPLYQAILGAGDQAALRTAQATGGLRSGSAISSVAQNQQNALLQAYNQQLQGVQGLANLPSYAPQIAQQTAGIGQTLGMGQTAAGQATAQGRAALLGGMSQAAGAYAGRPGV